jgi:hypothetical protein
MQNWLFPLAEQISMLGDLVTDLTGATVHLSETQPTLTPAIARTDLTPGESAFTGYAAATLTAPTGPYPDTIRGGVSLFIPTLTFSASNPNTAGQDVVGGWIQAVAAGTKLVLPFLFFEPVPMQVALAELNLTMLLNFFAVGPPLAIVAYAWVNGQAV